MKLNSQLLVCAFFFSRQFQEVHVRDGHVSGPLVLQKTLDFFANFGHDEFQASVCWLNKFQACYGMIQKLSVVKKTLFSREN